MLFLEMQRAVIFLTDMISDEGLEQESRKGNGGKDKNFKDIQE